MKFSFQENTKSPTLLQLNRKFKHDTFLFRCTVWVHLQTEVLIDVWTQHCSNKTHLISSYYIHTYIYTKGNCSPLIFVVVIVLVCCGVSLFCSIGSCFYLKNHLSPCFWFQCWVYVSYAHIITCRPGHHHWSRQYHGANFAVIWQKETF